MGNFVNVSQPLPESSWDYVEIYRASSESGTYSLIVTQAIGNLTYYDEDGISTSWYKVRFKNSTDSSYSTYSDAIKGQAESYTTMKDIKEFMHLSNDFSDSTKPSLHTIQNWISWAEDYIDITLGRAFRQKTISNEYHDIDSSQYRYELGIPIKLNYRAIRDFDTDEGDKIEIWEGGSGDTYVDYVTEKTEGRGDDFWVDYEGGVIYLRTAYTNYGKKACRVTYRYGEQEVPNDIKMAATMLIAKKLMLFEDRSMLLPEGESQNLNYYQKIQYLDAEIDKILKRRREFKVISY